MISLEVGGVQYGGFLSANVQIRMDALSNTFSFDAATEGGQPMPFKGGDAVKVYADEELVLTGNIELVTGSWAGQDHRISFEGRDKTGDLLDSTIGSLSDLKAPITLKTICKRVIAHIGADIVVVDEANPKVFSEAEDIASPEPGEGAFAFLEKYSRKRQVLLSSNELGNLLLTKSIAEVVQATVIHHIVDVDRANNVVKADVSYDSTGRFNVYKTMSQLNTSAGALFSASAVANQGENQQAIDDQIRVGRQLVLVAEAPTSGKDTLDRATWEANIRKARGRVYSAEVAGFRNQTGELWRVNTLPLIHDEFADIEARMLVNTVSFSNSGGAGTEKTVLGFLERNAYTLSLQEPVEQELSEGLFG